jgi:hypothetical protein
MKTSDWVMPSALKVGAKAAAATSASAVMAQVRRGWRPTARATLAQPFGCPSAASAAVTVSLGLVAS